MVLSFFFFQGRGGNRICGRNWISAVGSPDQGDGAPLPLVEDDLLDDRRAAPAELARPVHADVARRMHRLLPGAEPSALVAVGSRGRKRTPPEIVGQVRLEPVPDLFAKRLFLLAEVEVHGRLTTSSPRLGLRGPSPATSCGSHYHVIISPRTAGPQPRDVLRLALPHHTSAVDHQRLTRGIPGLVRGDEHRFPPP